MPKKPQDEDFYVRLVRDYAKPRQYSGYSAGQPAGVEGSVAPMPQDPAQAMPGGIPAEMFNAPGQPPQLPPMRMNDQTFNALMQGRPVPPQPAYAPAPPKPMDANTLGALMQGGQANQPTTEIPESTFIDGRQYNRPQGPPMPLGMALYHGVNRNALRESIFPYMQNLGLAR